MVVGIHVPIGGHAPHFDRQGLRFGAGAKLGEVDDALDASGGPEGDERRVVPWIVRWRGQRVVLVDVHLDRGARILVRRRQLAGRPAGEHLVELQSVDVRVGVQRRDGLAVELDRRSRAEAVLRALDSNRDRLVVDGDRQHLGSNATQIDALGLEILVGHEVSGGLLDEEVSHGPRCLAVVLSGRLAGLHGVGSALLGVAFVADGGPVGLLARAGRGRPGGADLERPVQERVALDVDVFEPQRRHRCFGGEGVVLRLERVRHPVGDDPVVEDDPVAIDLAEYVEADVADLGSGRPFDLQRATGLLRAELREGDGQELEVECVVLDLAADGAALIGDRLELRRVGEESEPGVVQCAGPNDGGEVEVDGGDSGGDGLRDDQLAGIGEVTVAVQVEVADEVPAAARGHVDRAAVAGTDGADRPGRCVEDDAVLIGGRGEVVGVGVDTRLSVGLAVDAGAEVQAGDLVVGAGEELSRIGEGKVAEVEIRRVEGEVDSGGGSDQGDVLHHRRRVLDDRGRRRVTGGGEENGRVQRCHVGRDGNGEVTVGKARERIVAVGVGRGDADQQVADAVGIGVLVDVHVDTLGAVGRNAAIAGREGAGVITDGARQRRAACEVESHVDGEIATGARGAVDAGDHSAGNHDGAGDRAARFGTDAVGTGDERHSCRHGDRYGPGAIGQPGERIEPIGVGRGHKGVDPVEYRDGDIGEAGLADVLHAVAVEVEPEVVTDDTRRLVAEVGAEVVRAVVDDDARVGAVAGDGGQGDEGLVEAGLAVAIGVGGLGCTAELGVGGVDSRLVGARWEAAEAVRSVERGGGRGDQGVVVAVVGGVLPQLDGDVGPPRLVPVLAAVAVGVGEDGVTDRAEGGVAHIDGVDRDTTGERDVDGVGRDRDREVADTVIGQIGVVRVDHDSVVAVGQTGEAVVAGPVGHGGGDQHVGSVAVQIGIELDSYGGQTELGGTLHGVAVGVEVDGVTDRGAALRRVAEILPEVGRGAVDGDGALAVTCDALADLIGITRSAGGQQRARLVDNDDVVVGRQQGERVGAVGGRGRGGDEHVGDAVGIVIAVEIDGDAADALVAGVLGAVAVPVPVDRVADRARVALGEREVPRSVDLAAGEGDRGRVVERGVGLEGLGPGLACGAGHRDRVGHSGREPVDHVVAVGVGGGAVDRGSVVGGDRPSHQRTLAGVPSAVAVDVFPQRAEHRRVGRVTEADAGDVLAGRVDRVEQSRALRCGGGSPDAITRTAGGAGIVLIASCAGSGVGLGRGGRARRQCRLVDVDVVQTVHEALEQVGAIAAGRGRAVHGPARPGATVAARVGAEHSGRHRDSGGGDDAGVELHRHAGNREVDPGLDAGRADPPVGAGRRFAPDRAGDGASGLDRDGLDVGRRARGAAVGERRGRRARRVVGRVVGARRGAADHLEGHFDLGGLGGVERTDIGPGDGAGRLVDARRCHARGDEVEHRRVVGVGEWYRTEGRLWVEHGARQECAQPEADCVELDHGAVGTRDLLGEDVDGRSVRGEVGPVPPAGQRDRDLARRVEQRVQLRAGEGRRGQECARRVGVVDLDDEGVVAEHGAGQPGVEDQIDRGDRSQPDRRREVGEPQPLRCAGAVVGYC